MRAFVSYSAVDATFAKWLAETLTSRGIPTWYDDWEINVGDSIVQKINTGLSEADHLVVVLTPSSVKSRWVAEELSAALSGVIDARGIKVLPVLKEDCEIPPLLRHRKYADFRADAAKGIAHLTQAILPFQNVCQQLAQLTSEHARIVDRLRRLPLGSIVADEISDLFRVMEDAVLLRVELSARTHRSKVEKRPARLSEAVEYLSTLGVDLRSQTWNGLADLRNRIAHGPSHRFTKLDVGTYYQLRYAGQPADALNRALDRLGEVMTAIADAPECTHVKVMAPTAG